LMHSDTVLAVAFSPDGRTLPTGSADGMVRRWDRETGRPVGPPLAHPHAVYALAVSPDGRAVLTGGGDLSRPVETATARLWDAATGKPLLSPIPHPDVVHGVAFRADGRAFVTGCRDGKLRFFEIGALRPTWREHLEVPILAAAFSPDGRSLLV